jgi:hypothetical protein
MVEENKFEPLLIDDDPESDYAALPERQAAEFNRQSAIWDITRELANIPYAGTGTKQEMVELENNMRSLIEEGVYGYKYIEGFLMSIGYALNRIRQTFRRLTGADPQIYLDAQPVLDTPGNIPGINYGWGKCKSKQWDYMFIMPYKVGFSVFGQKGDLIREEIKYLASLDEARDFLKSKVSDVKIYDEVLSIDKLAPTNNQYLSEDFLPLGTKTAGYAKVENYINQLSQHMQLSEKKAILEDALSNGQITEVEFNHLAIQNGILRQADPDIEKTDKEGNPDVERITTKEVLDEDKKLEDSPIKEELDEKTHMQFFEKSKDKKSGDNLSDVIEYIMESVSSLEDNLTDFGVNFRSLKYIAKDILDRIEKTPQVGDEKAQEVLSSSGTVSILVDFIDKTLPAESNMKQGLVVFSVVGDEVLSNDVFKGVDDKTYSLNEDGLSKYFYTDRQKNESK